MFSDNEKIVDISHKVSNSGFVIEFFGLSGVGKTTLAKELANELANRGVTVNSYPGKALFFVSKSASQQRNMVMTSMIHHPIALCRVFIALGIAIYNGNSIHEGLHYKFSVLVKWLKRWALYVDAVNKLKKKKQVSILDRGLATNILSIITRVDIKNIESVGKALMATGVIPNLVIVVGANREIIEKRRCDRGDQVKFWQLNWDYEFKKYNQVIDMLSHELQSSNGKLIHVTSDEPGSIKKNVNEICNYLIKQDEKYS